MTMTAINLNDISNIQKVIKSSSSQRLNSIDGCLPNLVGPVGQEEYVSMYVYNSALQV